MGKSIVQTTTRRNWANFLSIRLLISSSKVPLLIILLAATLSACSGERPADLGVRDGRLKSCPPTPNCVSSNLTEDADHLVQPLLFSAAPADVMARVRKVVTSRDRARIITENDHYLYAEFESLVFGFVDDVEFFLEAKTGTLHVRSASRIGHSDLGVNRERIEEIFSQLKGTDKKPGS